MKKLLVAFVLMLALLTTCLVGCGIVPDGNTGLDAEKENAAAVFTLDVNPGVRVFVKSDNSVITVEATNEDGEEIVAELDVEGEDYETAVEEIIDEMEENGYLEGDESSVLVSVEKKTMDISEKINDKINKAFEKHGKRASVIEQELDRLDKKMDKAIDEMAEKYHISKGKAHLIERIREEFPELSEEELAHLRINDLRMMLEDTSEDIKGHFKKVGEPIEDEYVGREAALEAALESLELTVEDVTLHRVRVACDKGNMIYKVEFVHDGMEYEITVDAVSGEVLSTESKEYVEFDPKEAIDEFCGKHGIDPDEFHNHLNDMFGKDDGRDDHKGEPGQDRPEEKPLTKGEILSGILAELQISEESLKKTDVKVYETEEGAVCLVLVESDGGDVYKIIVEACSGTIIKAELNGEEFTLPVEVAE